MTISISINVNPALIRFTIIPALSWVFLSAHSTIILRCLQRENCIIENYFVEENIWTMDSDGELRLTIMATLAQEESRKKAADFIVKPAA
jgi:site-specific recombinase